MDTEGLLTPESPAAAAGTYEAFGPAAQTVVRETTRRMGFDREEYDERVTGEVVETARDALFASLLSVRVGTSDEFEAWLDDHPDFEVERKGSEHVDGVVWHPVAFRKRVVAATYADRRDAAVATLRRIAFGRHYRPAVERVRADGDAAGSADATDARTRPDPAPDSAPDGDPGSGSGSESDGE